MFKVLLIDDEELARKRLRKMLQEVEPHTVVKEARDGQEALEVAAEFRPDIAFLDIEMPGLNGFETLQNWGESRPACVVFQTAYDEYAIRAFDEGAVDYLLKPFSLERFKKTWVRVAKAVLESTPSPLSSLEARLRGDGKYLRRWVATAGPRTRVIAEGEVRAFVSRDHVTCIVTRDGREATCELSLTELEERIDPAVFLRVHRSAIIALTEVAEVVGPAGLTRARLDGGLEVPIARARRSDLLRALGAIATL